MVKHVADKQRATALPDDAGERAEHLHRWCGVFLFWRTRTQVIVQRTRMMSKYHQIELEIREKGLRRDIKQSKLKDKCLELSAS